MDHDFYIELVAANGLEPLRPFVGEMPFKLRLAAEEGSDDVTLIQYAVSEFAGWFAVGPRVGDRCLFSASVRSSPLGDPEDVIHMVSSVFAQAKLAHWVWRIEHELDEDELVVDLGGSLHPTSHRGKQRWAQRAGE